MADSLCFCGCGERVGRWPLGIRQVNLRGQHVAERLAWAKAILGENVDAEWVAEGEHHVRMIRGLVHKTGDRRDVSEPEIRRWQEYGRQMEILAVQADLPSISAWLEAQPE